MKLILFVLASLIYLQCVASTNKPSPEKLKKFKEFLDKAKAKVTGSQEDAEFDGNLLRVDKKGGRIIVVRKMKLLDVRVKAIVERYLNETEVSLLKKAFLSYILSKITKLKISNFQWGHQSQ